MTTNGIVIYCHLQNHIALITFNKYADVLKRYVL